MSAVGPAMADVLGQDGTYWDPLWRVGVQLSALEVELLRCWSLRRLAFIAHAGASSVATTQSGSRLEHSLGLFALAAHFAPRDAVARVAALLHDVGHLPLSHTLEGVAGLDHHALGTERIRQHADLLARHGVDAEEVAATCTGHRPSVLSGAPGVLRLDHLDGLVRSARAHGRTRQAPPATLARLQVVGGCVSTDAETAALLVELVAAEARLHCSSLNVVTTAVVRHLAATLLDGAPSGRVAEVAAMTDDELWALLLTEPATARAARALREDPTTWRLVPPDHGPDSTGRDRAPGAIVFTIRRLYLDLPLVEGVPTRADHPALDGLPRLPWHCRILPAAPDEAR